MLYCMRWNQTMLGFSVELVSVVASDLPLASVSKMSGEEKKKHSKWKLSAIHLSAAVMKGNGIPSPIASLSPLCS